MHFVILIKVKLVFEQWQQGTNKTKIWSFEESSIEEIDLAAALREIEALYRSELQARNLRAKLTYHDTDFGCDIDIESNSDFRGVLRDLAAAWKRGEKKDCKLSVAEGLKPVAVKESPLKASLSAENSQLGDAFRQHILSSDKSDADSSEPDILEVEHLPVRGVTSDCEPGSSAVSAADRPPLSDRDVLARRTESLSLFRKPHGLSTLKRSLWR